MSKMNGTKMSEIVKGILSFIYFLTGNYIITFCLKETQNQQGK